MIWWVICENPSRIGFKNEFLTFTSENEVDLDELYILKITFGNGLEIGMGNFPQEFPATIYHKVFPQDFHATISRKISCKIFLQEFPARLSCKNFQQTFPARFSCKIFPQKFPARISHKNFPQDFPQDFPKLDPDWLAPYHPIPNAKFPPITAFLKLAFSPPPFSTRFSCKNFPQDFPTRISHKIFPQKFPALDPDWLAPHHPIPNTKCPPITALLNRPTYHKRSKVSPPPFSQILQEPQINE